MTRKLLMLRHGQTNYNATGRMQGQMDTELSEKGIAQAEAVARYFETVNISRIISSDLSRAAHTAEIVASRSGLPVSQDARLRETNLGLWQGRSRDEVDAEYPGARAQWRHDALWSPPGGESRLEVAARARAVIDELMLGFDEWDDGAVLLVAHGGVIGALTSDLLELSVEQHHMFNGLKNTQWAKLTARPRFQEPLPNINGEGDPSPVAPQPRFTAETLHDAQWYLDGWNMGVAPGMIAG